MGSPTAHRETEAVQGNQQSRRPTTGGFEIATADLGQQQLAVRQAVRDSEVELRGAGARVPAPCERGGTWLLVARRRGQVGHPRGERERL